MSLKMFNRLFFCFSIIISLLLQDLQAGKNRFNHDLNDDILSTRGVLHASDRKAPIFDPSMNGTVRPVHFLNNTQTLMKFLFLALMIEVVRSMDRGPAYAAIKFYNSDPLIKSAPGPFNLPPAPVPTENKLEIFKYMEASAPKSVGCEAIWYHQNGTSPVLPIQLRSEIIN
mgnify:CR=1 FL=1